MKKGSKESDPQKLASQLDQLYQLSSAELTEQWRVLFCAAPPAKLMGGLVPIGYEVLLVHTVRKESKPGESSPSPLIGKLFDEAGEGLTPSCAVKGNRRYRYYVSRSLMKGTARIPGQGWRVPALELERNLAAAVAGILDQHSTIATDVDEAGFDAHDLTTIFTSAKEWSARLRSEAEAPLVLKTLVERAELHQEGIRLSINLPIALSAKATANTPDYLLLTRQKPLKVKRRGVELRLVIGTGSGSSPRVDSTILKAIARAHRWFDDLVTGRSASMVEIGRREGVSKRYISRIIRLAFLSPAIVEKIVEGRQPPELTAQILSTGRGDLPLKWSAHEKLVGFVPEA